MADLNQLVQERANLTKKYNEVLERYQKAADAELQAIQKDRLNNQKQIDGILNTNAGLPDA
jgi:HPt (histidine-containing phosphotransfer) domain-containing protein